jgi:hypothetical protein
MNTAGPQTQAGPRAQKRTDGVHPADDAREAAERPAPRSGKAASHNSVASDYDVAMELGRRVFDGLCAAGYAAAELGRLATGHVKQAMQDQPVVTLGVAAGTGFVLGGGLRTPLGRVARIAVIRGLAGVALRAAVSALDDDEPEPSASA